MHWVTRSLTVRPPWVRPDCRNFTGSPRGFAPSGPGLAVSSSGIHGLSLFEFIAEEVLGGGGRVAGCGIVGDAEDQRQVQRVRAGGECFIQDAVLPDPLDWIHRCCRIGPTGQYGFV